MSAIELLERSNLVSLAQGLREQEQLRILNLYQVLKVTIKLPKILHMNYSSLGGVQLLYLLKTFPLSQLTGHC